MIPVAPDETAAILARSSTQFRLIFSALRQCGAWTVPNLSWTYSRLRDEGGLPRDLVLYLARHGCGTKVCRAKGIEYARRLLGHAHISTTQRSMHLDDQELAVAQDLVE